VCGVASYMSGVVSCMSDVGSYMCMSGVDPYLYLTLDSVT
jgi:hypothetical protein